MNRLTVTILIGILALAVTGGAGAAEISSQRGQTLVSVAALPAGVYDVTFRLQVDRLEQTVTPLATLLVESPGYPSVQYKQVTPINFPTAGQAVDFVLRFDNWRSQPVEARVDVKKPDAPAPALTVEKITVAPASGVVIGTVWPGKVLYFTKEAAQGLVSIYNGTAQPQTVTLRTGLESDLDRARKLGETPVQMAPGERKEVPVEWNTGADEWGYALAATVADSAGKPLDEAREYFSVADNLWSVGILQEQRGTGVPVAPGPNASVPVSQIQEYEKQLATILATPQPPVYWNYGNYKEFFAWAPEDFFNLSPTEDYWYSGTGNYTMGKRHLQMAVEWLHRRGMRATTYTNPFVIGYGSERIFQRHPEWFVYTKDGQLSCGTFYEKKLEIGEQLTTEGPFFLQLSPYAFTANVNPARLDVIEQQEQQLVKSHRMFGWDGVRYDNCVFSAYGLDSRGQSITGNDPAKKNALEAKAWRYLRQRLAQDLGPAFVVGTNFGWDFRDLAPLAWDEAARDGGLIMAEVPRSSWQPVSVNNRWVDYVARYHREGEETRALGGHYLTIGFDTQYPVDHLYLNVLTYADRTHPYYAVNSDNLPLGNYARFMTRYSALYWDVQRVKLLPDAEQRVKVESPASLWWKDYACVRQTPEGGRQYLINLVNPPAQERIHSDATNAVPAPQRDVKVTFTAPGEKLNRAWLLSADPTMTKTALPLTRTGDQVAVTVPVVYFWSLVIFE